MSVFVFALVMKCVCFGAHVSYKTAALFPNVVNIGQTKPKQQHKNKRLIHSWNYKYKRNNNKIHTFFFIKEAQ